MPERDPPPARYPRTVLGTCCVPWQSDGRVDGGCFRRTVANLVAAGLPDLYVFGTAGEGYAVTDKDFRRVVALFAETMAEAGGAAPMVGVISPSLPTMIERIAFARDFGVTTFQFSLPNWGVVSDLEMRRVFAALCDGFPDCLFLHYNLLRAGRLVRPAEYAELADAHPNLVATKYGGGDPQMIAGLLAEAPKLRHFFTEQGFYNGAPLGECGLLASVSSSNPKRARAYLDAAIKGDWQRLGAFHAELAGMVRALIDAVGPGRIDGAYDKVIHKLAEPDFQLALLPPYQSATEAAYQRYRTELKTHYPAWLPGASAAA